MPRKRVNDNIISVSMQNIRLCGEIIAVNRRTGGLESQAFQIQRMLEVNRRTGGLEINRLNEKGKLKVNRRTGGLEIYC